jgi:hypothetical protein
MLEERARTGRALFADGDVARMESTDALRGHRCRRRAR